MPISGRFMTPSCLAAGERRPGRRWIRPGRRSHDTAADNGRPAMTDATPAAADVITAPGNYQAALGGAADCDPADLSSVLTDPDGDGSYTRTVVGLPAGSYRVKIAHGLSWNENYGAGGVPGGSDIDFAVPAGWSAAARTDFRYDIGTHLLTVASRRVPNTADLAERSGHWLRRDLIAWDLPVEAVTEGWTVRLHS